MNRVRHLVGAVLLAALGGCGNDPAAPGASESQGQPLASHAAEAEAISLQLNWFPEVEHGGFYAALVHGHFQQEGLNVVILPGGPDTPVTSQVATGRATFGVSNADNVLFGRAQQAPLVALMAPLQTSPRCLMVHAASGIRTFADLKNMTLAMNPSLAFVQYLRKHAPLENVRIVPYPGNVAQFLIDPDFGQQGYVFSEPFVARQQGGDPQVLMLSDLGYNPYTSLLVATEETVRSKSDLVHRMVRACQKGWADYLANPGPTNQHIHTVNPEMKLDVLAYGAEALRPLAEPADAGQRLGQMSAERWRTLCDQLVETEQLKAGQVDPAAAFTNEFLGPAPAARTGK